MRAAFSKVFLLLHTNLAVKSRFGAVKFLD